MDGKTEFNIEKLKLGMESVWKRSNRLTVNTDHNSATTTTTTPTAITPTSTSSTKLIQLQRTNSPNGVTASMAASTVLLAPTTPLGMGSGLSNSSSGSSYLAKRMSISGVGEDKDNKEKENGNNSNGLVLTRQQFTPSPTNCSIFFEDFWAVYSHLRRPHELPNISDYHLFKQGVRPVWEDDTNINGGKWIVRLKKGLASRYWESLVMAVIGDQFDVGTEICGAVLSIRSSEDILSLWNQSAHEGRINLKIRDTMKRVLNLPSETIMEYKTHNDALKDNSSFRNTDVFR
ncbi:unnamed protein product [Rhizophagus irregularis]|nr:unnamed protein product [Rhizophagus irregularis]